jgi:hypothetical protein
VHDVVDRLLERHETDRSFFARLRDAVGELAPIENFMPTVALDHAQIAPFDFFVSGKAKSTGETNAATSDAGAVARLSGINDLIIAIAALWTAHNVVRRNFLHYTL